MWKLCIASLALCLTTASAALAADLKIAYIDMREIFTNSEPAKQAKGKLESKFGADRDKFEKQAKDLQKQRESLQNPGPNPNREEFEKKRRDYITKQQEFDRKAQEFGAKLEKEEAQLRNDMLDIVFKAAKELAVKKGVSYMVGDVNAGILYADPSLDMTKELMEEVNRMWKENPSGSKKK